MGLGVYVVEELKRKADTSDNPALAAFVKMISFALGNDDVGASVAAYTMVSRAVDEVTTNRDGTAMEALTIATFILASRTHTTVNVLEERD